MIQMRDGDKGRGAVGRTAGRQGGGLVNRIPKGKWGDGQGRDV